MENQLINTNGTIKNIIHFAEQFDQWNPKGQNVFSRLKLNNIYYKIIIYVYMGDTSLPAE